MIYVRKSVYGKNGMVATTQPLAAQVGLDILKKGGNAIDAAIAAAACLTVVEPTSCGIGGDAFAIIWYDKKLYGLNSSGPAPNNISIEKIKDLGYADMPEFGWCTVTVPGVPAAWAELSNRFGKLPFINLMEPAISYADEGYSVTPTVADSWCKSYDIYKENLKGEEFKFWFETFAPKGRAPMTGEIWSSKELASTLKEIAKTNSQSFYKGDLAEKIDRFSEEYGGYIKKEDIEAFRPEWAEPISINYKGFDIWELPPNGQGLVVLMALNILKTFNFDNKDDVRVFHKQIEAIKLAFADGKKHITDIKKMRYKSEYFLTEEYAKQRRCLIQDNKATYGDGVTKSGGTVYLTTADSEGNMVSFIQSNYKNFGSGLVVPDTGIALQSRGADFSLNPEYVNCLEPGKKSYHTIIPGFLTKDGEAIGTFGVTGAYMQPQGHLQVLMKMIDFGLDPQEALDAPRWQWLKDKTIAIESHFSKDLAEKLSSKGHDIKVESKNSVFGRGQIIIRDKNGVLIGGTESRADGTIAVY